MSDQPTNPLVWLERQPGYWRGRARTRHELSAKSTSDNDRLAHERAAAEYERRADASPFRF